MLTSCARHHAEGRTILFTTAGGKRLCVTSYENSILRIHAAYP